MKIVTIIGARPQIIKAAAVSRAIRNHFTDLVKEIIVHTGQHYDANMSQVFFDELGIPEPDYNLNIGSGSHGVQTAGMITGIEEILLKEKPDYLVIYGDTNSTLAGAIAASKIHVPIAHIEAGLRSFNKSMPEEINRIMADHASNLLFTPTKTGLKNLINEGFNKENLPPFSADHPGIFHCGDIMYDNSLYFEQIARKKSNILNEYNLIEGNYFLATVHRDNNTDQPERLNALFEAFVEITSRTEKKLILPLHPRTSKLLKKNLKEELYQKVSASPYIKLIPPATFLDMILLEKNCDMVFTDSGGVQKEAYFFNKPAIILRSETEWKEILEEGCGLVADANKDKILDAFDHFASNKKLDFFPLFGDGKAAEFILKTLLENVRK
ncbi:MAG: UDP-N-acetylglucosamine 2-epimerase (non-hydrolyzing) [Bacteroidales bacterium]|nr:UDP-N-acetylglucosamine 2-epimerase (non-hydrolyzing) [Bacteroidales bacterium]